jgi:hypothetical protein
MKIKYLLLIAGLFASSVIYAQNSTFKSLFEKYENEDDITVVSISKAMFNLIPGNIKTGNVDIKDIVPKIESMLIITSDKNNVKEKMSADFKSLVERDRNYEELMRVKSGKSNITFNMKKRGNLINELIMLVDNEEDFVAIQILGNFTIEDIQKIANDTQK